MLALFRWIVWRLTPRRVYSCPNCNAQFGGRVIGFISHKNAWAHFTMSTEPPTEATMLANENTMLREYARAGVEPVHSQGFLFSLDLVRSVTRGKAEMAKALKEIENG